MDSKFKDLENLKWSSDSAASKGPKRLCKFCTLGTRKYKKNSDGSGILLPIVLLCVPLYMKFRALKPHFFLVSPSDMKLLNQESRVSTVWCEGQVLSMNGTFNAYLLKERPKLKRWKHGQHVTMNRNMMLEDDIKEYWGFYLLRGSIVRLSVCSRHEGASFIMVKDLKNAKRCAWLGELDSEEESDEISDEFEFKYNLDNPVEKDTSEIPYEDPDGDNFQGNVPRSNYSSIRGVNGLLDQIQNMNVSMRQMIIYKMLRSMKQDPKSVEAYSDMEKIKQFFAFQVESDNPILSSTTTERNSRGLNFNLEEEFQDHGGEVFDEIDDTTGNEDYNDVVYDLQHVGQFNQKDKNKVDKSREETKSSWSSSEEALQACEGLIFNIPLNGGTQCHINATSDELKRARLSVEYTVEKSGFYYFIFANENEMTDNFLSARFDLHKTVFDVSQTTMNCTNSFQCKLPLAFWSHDHVVIEVPENNNLAKKSSGGNGNDTDEDPDPCSQESLLRGFSSLDQCHQVLLAESVCTPRKPIYLIFLLLAPVLILFCAHI